MTNIYKIVFAGPVGAGKTTAIKSLSDIEVVSTDTAWLIQPNTALSASRSRVAHQVETSTTMRRLAHQAAAPLNKAVSTRAAITSQTSSARPTSSRSQSCRFA